MIRQALIAIALSASFSAPVLAQDADAPSYENGPVWGYTEIRTVDGHFDDYMNWLSTSWKAQEEALKKAGVITDYKVLVMADPRENEGDLMLAVQYPNMAAFDMSVADGYAMQKKISGSLAKASKEQADRGMIRTIKSNYLMREAKLK